MANRVKRTAPPRNAPEPPESEIRHSPKNGGGANRLLEAAVEKYEKKEPKLAAWMEQNLPEGFTVFAFPKHLRKRLRTNNLEERLNRSIKARTRLISVFPNQQSQLRLVDAICMEISDDWETGSIYLNVKDL